MHLSICLIRRRLFRSVRRPSTWAAALLRCRSNSYQDRLFDSSVPQRRIAARFVLQINRFTRSIRSPPKIGSESPPARRKEILKIKRAFATTVKFSTEENTTCKTINAIRSRLFS
jgi:hypothetical protein